MSKKVQAGHQDPAAAIRQPPATCHLRVWHSATATDHLGDFESRCEQLLAPPELAAADRYRRTTTRNQHVVGRAMARRLLGGGRFAEQSFGNQANHPGGLAPIVDPQSIEFAAGQHGKPHVVSPPQANRPFNIAHTDGLVLCGVADNEAETVGVDVESLSRETSTELAERYFSAPEIEFLRSRPAEQQRYFFLKIWTLKEAFIKAIGTGLQTPLADFAFEGIDTDRPQIRFLDPGLERGYRWNFVCFQPRDGFIAAAAVVPKWPQSQVFVDWQPFEGLLNNRQD